MEAETIFFEVDDAVKIVRVYDNFGNAVADIIGEKGAGYLCIAFDDGNQPMETATAFADIGQAFFTGVDANLIARVECRKN